MMNPVEEIRVKKTLAAEKAVKDANEATTDEKNWTSAINHLNYLKQYVKQMSFEDIQTLETYAAQIFSAFPTRRSLTVVVIVEGGVARVESAPIGIKVEIRDLDNENHG